MAQDKRLRLDLVADQDVTLEVIGAVTDRIRLPAALSDFVIADTDLRVLEEQSIAASGSLSLDLSGGSLSDPRGNVADFATITQLIVIHKSTSSSSGVSVGGNLADAVFGGTVSVPVAAGGCAVKCDPAGISVVNTTQDNITITNSDAVNAADVVVVIIGVSV